MLRGWCLSLPLGLLAIFPAGCTPDIPVDCSSTTARGIATVEVFDPKPEYSLSSAGDCDPPTCAIQAGDACKRWHVQLRVVGGSCEFTLRSTTKTFKYRIDEIRQTVADCEPERSIYGNAIFFNGKQLGEDSSFASYTKNCDGRACGG
jgi:hypothetical protein